MSARKGQAALEYMMVISLVLLFIIPVWAYMSTVNQEATNEINYAYGKNAARKVIDAAELVYSQGPPASVEINVYIPRYVQWVNVTNETISFRMNAGYETDVFGISTVPLNGTMPIVEGNYFIKVESKGAYVQIDPVY